LRLSLALELLAVILLLGLKDRLQLVARLGLGHHQFYYLLTPFMLAFQGSFFVMDVSGRLEPVLAEAPLLVW